MFHFLLTVEHLAVLLLVWTWLIAVMANRSPRFRWLMLSVVFLIFLAWTGLIAGGWIFLATLYPPLWLISLTSPLLLFIGFAVGATVIAIRARHSPDSAPAGRVALVLAVAIAIHFVSWANQDAAVQKEIASLRTEAYHMAEFVAPPQVSDRENAAPLYQEIFDAWDVNDWPKQWPAMIDANTEDLDVRSKEGQAFLESRRHFIDRLRQAASMPQCRFEHEYYRPAPDILLPEIQFMRDAGRLLAIDAMSHFAAGRIDDACRNIDAMWSIADHAASQPFVISFLVGLAIERQAINALEWGMGQGDWKDRKLPKLAMETGGIAARLRLHRALALEESMGILMCCDAAQGQGAAWDPNFSVRNYGSSALFTTAYRVFPFFAQDVNIYRQRMRRMRQYSEMLPIRPIGAKFKSEMSDMKGVGLLPQFLLPMQERLLQSALQAEIPREAVRLGIQVFRYELKHGKQPTRLQELVPDFVTVVPRDPYGKDVYRFIPAKEGRPWIVYSIGPDGEDNGGARIQSGNTGDIVVSPRRKKDHE